MVLIRFTKARKLTPTGRTYVSGTVVEVSDEVAAEFISEGAAVAAPGASLSVHCGDDGRHATPGETRGAVAPDPEAARTVISYVARKLLAIAKG